MANTGDWQTALYLAATTGTDVSFDAVQTKEVLAMIRDASGHVESLIDDEHCAFGDHRKPGETCRQARTRMQGVTCAGCAECEARDFLKEIGARR
jgi:hypothetical protein